MGPRRALSPPSSRFLALDIDLVTRLSGLVLIFLLLLLLVIDPHETSSLFMDDLVGLSFSFLLLALLVIEPGIVTIDGLGVLLLLSLVILLD